MKLPVSSQLFVSCGLLLISGFGVADDSRPFYVEIAEIHEYTYSVKWRIPETIAEGNRPTVELPKDCELLNSPDRRRTMPATRHATGRAIYRCKQSLSGQSVVIQYPDYNTPVSGFMSYQAVSGERHSQIFSPNHSQWRIPEKDTAGRVARDYTLLGIQHILGGTDHLLFIVCLLWIAGIGRRILITITGFTLAHSATLALSALNVVTVPVPPVEASIALSIVILVSEIIKERKHSLTWRYPISVSSAFGLLHGFGFAAALSEIGLPQTELATGLLFFNVGVEIGQILFAGTIIILVYIAKGLVAIWPKKPWPRRQFRLLAGYCTGSIASFWLVERCVSFL
ncbi:MAG: HupE/UreJ family protein [Gammaproteobacteria bacterium]|nr:HupE/UreJ family protein [Gammaproteobacteria bacterium]